MAIKRKCPACGTYLVLNVGSCPGCEISFSPDYPIPDNAQFTYSGGGINGCGVFYPCYERDGKIKLAIKGKEVEIVATELTQEFTRRPRAITLSE